LDILRKLDVAINKIRLQGRPSPAEAQPIEKIHPFSKIAVTFEPLNVF
jgi:hypothetical protein